MDHFTISIIHRDDAVRHSMRFLFEAHGWSVHAFRTLAEFLGVADAADATDCLVVASDHICRPDLRLVAEARAGSFTKPIVLIGIIDDLGMRLAAARLGATIVDLLSGDDLAQVVEQAIRTGRC